MSDPARTIDEVHLEGWTVLRVRGPLTGVVSESLTALVGPQLGADGAIAVDLGHHPCDEAGAAAVVALEAAAAGAGARWVVVAADAATRARLRAAGATSVHESLDAALEVTAPPLLTAGPDAARPPLAPSTADSIITTTEDFTHGPGSA